MESLLCSPVPTPGCVELFSHQVYLQSQNAHFIFFSLASQQYFWHLLSAWQYHALNQRFYWNNVCTCITAVTCHESKLCTDALSKRGAASTIWTSQKNHPLLANTTPAACFPEIRFHNFIVTFILLAPNWPSAWYHSLFGGRVWFDFVFFYRWKHIVWMKKTKQDQLN